MKIIAKLVSLIIKGVVKSNNVIGAPIRVVERQMDGCMAHYCSREDYGTVIDHDMRHLYGSGKALVDYWLIKWDGDRKDDWYPACFFVYKEENGTHVRLC